MSEIGKIDENVKKYIQRCVSDMKNEILSVTDQRCREICGVINPISLKLQKGEKLVISLQVSMVFCVRYMCCDEKYYLL